MALHAVHPLARDAEVLLFGVLLHGEAVEARVVRVLAGAGFGQGELVRVVHRVPRSGNDIVRVRVKVAGPQEEGLVFGGKLVDEGVRALGNPRVVVVLLGDVPVTVLAFAGTGRLAEALPPVLEALFLHPDRVVLADVGLIGVVAGEFEVIEAVERALVCAPEVQVLKGRVRLQRGILRRRGQRLEVCLAHQRGLVAEGVPGVVHRGDALVEFCPEGVGAVLARILAGQQAGAGRRAGRIGAVGAVKDHAACGQAVEVGCLDLGVVVPHRHPVLLIAGDEEDVWAGR